MQKALDILPDRPVCTDAFGVDTDAAGLRGISDATGSIFIEAYY